MKKLLFLPLLSFCILISSCYSSALDSSSIWDFFGMSYDEFLEYEVYDGFYEIPVPSVFASVYNPDFVKDEPLDCSIRYASSDNTWYADVAVGSCHYIGHNKPYVDLTFYNNGKPLFDEGGKLTLKLYAMCANVDIYIYRTDGSILSRNLVSGNSSTTIYTIDVDIDNSNNDVSKLLFRYRYGVLSSNGDTYIDVGVADYGYLHNEPEPEPEPEPEVPLVKGDLNGTIEYLISTLVAVVDCFFLLQIVDGVTFGSFILASLIFAVAFSFLFHKIVK